jgi:hypothetical protein
MLNKKDILVIVYPSFIEIEALIIINPYDKEIKQFEVSSIEDIKKILMEQLPWCSQNHPPLIHGGCAHILEWESLPSGLLKIKIPEELEELEKLQA